MNPEAPAETILVVDDEPGIVEAYQTYLLPREAHRVRSCRETDRPARVRRPSRSSPRGYALITASSGREAVQRVEDHLAAGGSLSCGFFDMMMPGGMDGLDTIRAIRKLVPTLLCTVATAHQDRPLDDIHREFSPGHEDEWDYLAKPFTALEVQQKARCMVSSARRRQVDADWQRTLERLVRASHQIYEGSEGTEGFAERAHASLTEVCGGGMIVELSERGGTVQLLQGCSASFSSLKGSTLIDSAAERGVALQGRHVAVALTGGWPRQVLVTESPERAGSESRRSLELLAAVLDGARTNALLWDGVAAAKQELEARVDARTRELERALEDLKAAQARTLHSERLAVIGQLSAGVAHEINNPLTFVVGNHRFALEQCREARDRLRSARLDELETLRGDLLMVLDDVVELDDDVESGLRRIGEIVRDMKILARRDDEQEPGRVELGRVLRTAATLSAGVVKPFADLHVAVSSERAGLGYEGKLVQCVTNLLTNAAQALEGAGGPRGHVRCRVYDDAEEVVLEVADDGPGVPAAIAERIREPFYTTKRRGVGSGLGLALTREMVEACGGNIVLRSAPGEGACFEIRLPAADADISPAAEEETSADEVVASPHGLTVLLVDDEELVARSLGRMLRSRHEVEVVTSGDDAVRYLETRGPPDLLLCDVVMAPEDGPSLCKRIAEIHPDLRGRIVFMTGGTCTPATAEFIESYRGPVLAKPIDLDQIEKVAASLPHHASLGAADAA